MSSKNAARRSSDIHLRPLEIRDFAALGIIAGEAWDINSYSDSPAMRRRLMRHYMYYYMQRQNFARVAVADGRPAGFIIGRCENVPLAHPLRYRLGTFLSALPLRLSRIGRIYLFNVKKIADADAKLTGSSRFGGELMLFAVDKNLRGGGIGRMMLDSYKDYLRNNGVRDFFLYTDDYSDVDYYRTRGYTEVARTEITFGHSETSSFYMFGYTL